MFYHQGNVRPRKNDDGCRHGGGSRSRRSLGATLVLIITGHVLGVSSIGL
jgi:hypothetical protein